MTQATHPTDGMTDELLADYYDETHDLSEFDLDAPQPVTPSRQRLDVSITVRFTPSEIDALRTAADEQGVKVTALIRSLAVQHRPGAQVVDVVGARQVLSTLVRELSEKLGGGASVTLDAPGPREEESGLKPQKSTPTRQASRAKSTTKSTAATTARTKTTKRVPAPRATPAKSSDLGLAAAGRRTSSSGSRAEQTQPASKQTIRPKA